jgi:hypothetical protein
LGCPLLETFPSDYILNCDKTMPLLYPHNILTWVKTSADDVTTYIDDDEKAGITVLATVSANGIKWDLPARATALRAGK